MVGIEVRDGCGRKDQTDNSSVPANTWTRPSLAYVTLSPRRCMTHSNHSLRHLDLLCKALHPCPWEKPVNPQLGGFPQTGFPYAAIDISLHVALLQATSLSGPS